LLAVKGFEPLREGLVVGCGTLIKRVQPTASLLLELLKGLVLVQCHKVGVVEVEMDDSGDRDS